MDTMEVPNYGTVVVCPYNNAHQILAERLQKHLVKCRRQYPNAKITACPFNNAHHIPEQELKLHTKTCPDRGQMESFKYAIASTPAPQPQAAVYVRSDGTTVLATAPPVEDVKQDDDENWDDMDAPAYNPAKYCANNLIIRKATHKTAAEKRQFYEDERVRHEMLKKGNA
uniref:gametocyte-specific factor 1 homolog n=1 Tax=Anopheles coluzzii TaxID=1518534 RepID=UPI0020FFBF16|nr:gametocyte-specific factor 1 homolog [Anopheles coluzzii]